MQFLLVSFCELKGVPFTVHTCSMKCQDEAKTFYNKINDEMQKIEDQQYSDTIKRAQKMVDSDKVDISTNAINAPEGQVDRFNPLISNWRASDHRQRHRRRKCVIM